MNIINCQTDPVPMNREVSIRSLLEDGLIEPGENILSLDLQVSAQSVDRSMQYMLRR